MVKRFLRGATNRSRKPSKNPKAAVDAMLKANPKAGKRDADAVELTTALYKDPTAKHRPLRVATRT